MSTEKETKELTIEEKAVIFDILKFTPTDYTFSVWGYGGDSRFLRATKEQYKYFKEKEIDIEDYAGSWDNEFDVPEEMQPFPPGEPYEGDEVDVAGGCTMDDGSHLTITDSNGQEIFSCTMDPGSLEDEGVEVDEVNEFYPDYDCKKGDVLIWHANGEKGTFFGCTVRFTKPFDPKKLKVNYTDFDGWMMLTSIEYDGEELFDDDYSTTGKWGETKWVIVGGEEAIENDEPNVEIKPDVTLPERTAWYPAAEYNPTRKGHYECMFGGTVAWPFSNFELVEWTGEKWNTENQISQWRGLTEEVK